MTLQKDPLWLLANTCERVNSFAQHLQAQGLPATTGTDLRIYNGQWMLEKWIEAKLNDQTGETAVWWLEISKPGEQWKIHLNTSVSYGEYDQDVFAVTVQVNGDMDQAAEDCLNALAGTFDKGAEFRAEIDRILKGKSSV